MYKVSLNNRITLRRPVQARRPMSTNVNVRKGGISKLVAGGLILSAAGMAYYQNYQKHESHSGDSDPYARTRKTLSDASDKLTHDDHLQEKSSGAIDELGYAGKHIKNSAELATDAARDAFSTVGKEGKSVVDNIKAETRNLKDTVVSEADKKVSDANQAAFNAANKFKQAKETVSHEIEKDVNKVSGFFKSEKDSLVNDHNPMVYEKISTEKTKPTWETRLENEAADKIHDTSKLVEKDTEKVKQVWDDGSSSAKSSFYNVESEVKSALDEKTHAVKDTASSVKSSLFNLFGSAEDSAKDTANNVQDAVNSTASNVKDTIKDTAKNLENTVKYNDRIPWETRLASENAIPSKTDQDIVNATKPPAPGKKGTSFDYYHNSEKEGNPMVFEKHSTEKTKPLWETSLEEHAQEIVHDTSTLVDKDTEKVKQGVWDAKSIANEKAGTNTKHSEGGGFWASLFGTEKKVANQVEDHAEEAKQKWESLKSKADVTKDDVKEGVTQTWQDVKDKAANEATRAKNSVDSTINDLSYKSNKEANRLETGWNNLKNDANYEAEQARHKAEDVANKAKNETNRFVSDVTDTAKDIKDEGSRLTRQASNIIAGSFNDASSKAEDLKYKAEDTAKSWYQKGTEQVKSSINNVKNVADKDINWVEEKIHNGVEGAKDEVDRLLGFHDPRHDGYEGHVIRGEKFAEHEAGQLRATRNNVDLKPAAVVVEEAHSKDM